MGGGNTQEGNSDRWRRNIGTYSRLGSEVRCLARRFGSATRQDKVCIRLFGMIAVGEGGRRQSAMRSAAAEHLRTIAADRTSRALTHAHCMKRPVAIDRETETAALAAAEEQHCNSRIAVGLPAGCVGSSQRAGPGHLILTGSMQLGGQSANALR